MGKMKKRRVRSGIALFFVMFILLLQFAPILTFAQVQPWQGESWGNKIPPWKLDEWKGQGSKNIQQWQAEKWQMQQWYLQTVPNASTWEAEKWANDQWQMQQWYMQAHPGSDPWEAKQWAFQQWQFNQWQMQGQTDQKNWEGNETQGNSHSGDGHQGDGTTGNSHSGNGHQGEGTKGDTHSGDGTKGDEHQGNSSGLAYDPGADGFTKYDGFKYAVNDVLVKQVALGTDMVKGEYFQVLSGQNADSLASLKGSGSWKEFLISSLKVSSSNVPGLKDAVEAGEAVYKGYDAYNNFADYQFLKTLTRAPQTRIDALAGLNAADQAYFSGAARVIPKVGIGMGAVGLAFSGYETWKNVNAAIDAKDGYDRAESIGKTISSVGEMVGSIGTMGMMTPAGVGLMAVGGGLFVAGYAVQGVTKLIKNRQKIKDGISNVWNGAKSLFGFGKG
ncbi:hypothetical protein ACFOU2_13040 [Bacillus songklensis]|uniref:Uncharacterized protein n=1 Tax=Bacillus songklensis TaxID=1069116 RepID=A0ABV8B4R0_9BACI